jgi:hypothetical protein
MFIKRLGYGAVFGLFAFTSLACGPDQEQIVTGFQFNVEDEKLALNIEFNKDTELNTEFRIPIMQYGAVSLAPGNETHGFTIGVELDLRYIDEQDVLDLEKTRLLPNGQPMSAYVKEEVARLHIKASEEVYTSVYLGTNMDAMYAGTAIELNFLNEKFPSGLVISQRIRDQQKRDLGVVTMFGPKVENGQVVAPGGFFVITNVTDLLKYYPPKPKTFSSQSLASQVLIPDDKITINAPYRDYFSKAYNRQKLLMLYQEQARAAGMSH